MINQNKMTADLLLSKMQKACKKISPVWPLQNFVAVNPFLGLLDLRFEKVADLLSGMAGIQMTMSTSFYLKQMEEGKMLRQDLKTALAKFPEVNMSLEKFIAILQEDAANTNTEIRLKSFAEVASSVSAKDWKSFMTDRITSWAASYFDNIYAQWNTVSRHEGIFQSWKQDASIDRTPDVMGLKDFHKHVGFVSDQPIKASLEAIELLQIDNESLDLYLHKLLLQVGGWAAYIRRMDWENGLNGIEGNSLMEFLSILLSWEACLNKCLGTEQTTSHWKKQLKQFSDFQKTNDTNESLLHKLVLQEAYELSLQRLVEQKLNKNVFIEKEDRPLAQGIFCIDVRSEVFRRNLESVNSNIETIGFAGFFGFPVKLLPIGHGVSKNQYPVLLTPKYTVLEKISDRTIEQQALEGRLLKHQVSNAWNTFKRGAVSCFGFVSSTGLSYLPKLFTDTFGITRTVPHPDHEGLKSSSIRKKKISLNVEKIDGLSAGIEVETQAELAMNALAGMTLTRNFGKFVLFVGHGSTTVNNPHATGLDCGACGGNTGEANAKVAAQVLNDPKVRTLLKKRGISIPQDTIFLACKHDTTTDVITVYNESDIPQNFLTEWTKIKVALEKAGKLSRLERADRLNIQKNANTDLQILQRSKDWSEVRPEWGLAGCTTFVVAPRNRTKGINLNGSSFLHSYDWNQDKEFKILELIMTAPMVVTNWINLQYYASTVDNKHYGSGNKTLHNITGGYGVLEGFGGDLRTGLPWQSVYDGEKFQHNPSRLNVYIEAPVHAIEMIIKKHDLVRNLCDNRWLNLFTINEVGKVHSRYLGNEEWEVLSEDKNKDNPVLVEC